MRIKVTGYVEIDEDQYDPGPLGPLTEEANMEYTNLFGLEDIQFEEVES